MAGGIHSRWPNGRRSTAGKEFTENIAKRASERSAEMVSNGAAVSCRAIFRETSHHVKGLVTGLRGPRHIS